MKTNGELLELVKSLEFDGSDNDPLQQLFGDSPWDGVTADQMAEMLDVSIEEARRALCLVFKILHSNVERSDVELEILENRMF